MGVTDYQQILMGKPNALNYETQTEQSALQRKRRLVQMLMQQALGGTQMIDAGQLKVANWGDALANVFKAAMAGKMDDEVGKEEQDVARKNAQRSALASDQFFQAVQGAEPQGPMPDGSAMPKQRPDLVRAMAIAQASGDPTLRGLGEKMLLEDQKQRAPKLGESAGVGYQMEMGENGPQVRTAPINQYTQDPNNPLLNRNVDTGQVQGTTLGNVTPPQPAKEFNKAKQEADMKLVLEGKDKSGKAWDTLQMIADAQNQIKAMSPESFGKLAPLKSWLNQVAVGLGGQPFPEGAQIENLAALTGERLLERLRMFAPVSNYDAEQMRQIAGSTSNTREALERILDYAAKVASRVVNEHNIFTGQLEQEPGYGDMGRYKSFREVTGALPIEVPRTLEDDMKKYLPKKR